MEIGVKVGDIMTRKFVSVGPGTPIINCAKDMIKKHVGSLIIKENGRVLGILTEKDIIWALTKKRDLSRIRAKDIMTRRVATISPSKDIYDALLKMKKKKIRWLPVVIKKNIIGMITLKDILRIEPSLFDIAVQNMQIREEKQKLKSKGKNNYSLWIKEGGCEKCGARGILYNVYGKFLCEQCKE